MNFDPLVHVLLTLTAVVSLGWLLGRLCRLVGQPAVIGEVLAGIVLGPSLLGAVWPAATEILLPASNAGYLKVIAQLGIIIYMFLVGLELNLDQLKNQARTTIAISGAGIFIPFALGVILALLIRSHVSRDDVPALHFVLFMGVVMAITAFPVLARILSDRGMQQSPLGQTALACAALGDAAAWCVVAVVVGIVQAAMGNAVLVIVLTIGFIAVLFLVVRPIASKLLNGRELTRGGMGLVFVALLLSALTTELIGIHALFGAFLFGAIIPHDSAIARAFTHKLHDFVTVVLLPAYFAYTGLRTQIGLVVNAEDWLICGLIIVVATAGKIGGTLLAARGTGMAWRDSAALGILMNTRGLMELIVLNIGYDLGIISPTLFAMMVLMALVTTIATTPLLQLFGAAADRHQVSSASGSGVNSTPAYISDKGSSILISGSPTAAHRPS